MLPTGDSQASDDSKDFVGEGFHLILEFLNFDSPQHRLES